MAGRPAVAGGSRSSGGRRHRVKNGPALTAAGGARASVTGPGPDCGRDGGPGPLRATTTRRAPWTGTCGSARSIRWRPGRSCGWGPAGGGR